MSPPPAPPPGRAAAARRIADVFAQGGAGAWSTMTGAELAYQPGETHYGAPPAVAEASEGAGEMLATRIEWSGDRSGQVVLLVAVDGAKAIVANMMALMMGGPADVAGTQLDAEGMDAYAEAANNFVGQGAQALRGELGGAVKFAIRSTERLAWPADAAQLGAEPWAACAGTFTLGGTSFPVAVWMTPTCTGVAAPSGSSSAGAEAPGGAGEPAGEGGAAARYAPGNLAHVMKMKVPFVVVLAEKKMRMELIQEMAPGTIIEFRKQSGEILDVCANNVKIAEAEVVTTNQHFGVQLRRMIDPRAVRKD